MGVPPLQLADMPPLQLADMPPELIGNVVRQAALVARSTPNPARSIFEWMRFFCIAASEDSIRCRGRDDWYRLALAAFGFEPSTFPPRFNFKDWRSFFFMLCKAFTPLPSVPTPTPMYEAFWNNALYQLYPGLGGLPPASVWMKRFLSVEMPQYEMDELLDGLLRSPSCGQVEWNRYIMGDKPTGDTLCARRFEKASPLMAMVTLLVMRGALAFRKQYWIETHNKMYATLLGNVTGVFTLPWETITDQMNAFLQLGADPNYAGRLVPVEMRVALPIGVGSWQHGRPCLLMLAVKSEHAPIVRLLLDAGAHLPQRPMLEAFFKQVLEYCRKPAATSDQEATKKLINLVDGFVQTMPVAASRGPYNESIHEWVQEVALRGESPPDWIWDAIVGMLEDY